MPYFPHCQNNPGLGDEVNGHSLMKSYSSHTNLFSIDIYYVLGYRQWSYRTSCHQWLTGEIVTKYYHQNQQHNTFVHNKSYIYKIRKSPKE